MRWNTEDVTWCCTTDNRCWMDIGKIWNIDVDGKRTWTDSSHCNVLGKTVGKQGNTFLSVYQCESNRCTPNNHCYEEKQTFSTISWKAWFLTVFTKAISRWFWQFLIQFLFKNSRLCRYTLLQIRRWLKTRDFLITRVSITKC